MIASLFGSLTTLLRHALIKVVRAAGTIRYVATKDSTSSWRVLLELHSLSKGRAMNLLQKRWDTVRN
eukprot:831878-Amphidinium_carterae.1